ncbi:integral membrane protein, partial [Colletotrichum musicola]
MHVGLQTEPTVIQGQLAETKDDCGRLFFTLAGGAGRGPGDAGKAPPGNETSNFIDPPNQNAMVTAIMSVCVAVVVLCLSVRAYARILVLKRVQAQEYLILAAFACFLGWTYCTMKLTESPGYYVHTWNVKLRQTVDMGL